MQVEHDSRIFFEFVELFIHNVLYVRKLYPSQIFTKKKAYYTPVMQSVYPKLNEYISKNIKSAKEILEDSRLHQIEVLIYKRKGDMDERIESYFFRVMLLKAMRRGSNKDEEFSDNFLYKLEENLKRALLDLEHQTRILQPLPPEAQFKILLHTSKYAYVKLCTRQLQDEKPWIQLTEAERNALKSTELLPISKLPSMNVSVRLETYNAK